MKRYQVKKQNRAFGNKCDWYNRVNLGAVEAANPTYPCGNRQFPAAYFVFKTEWVRDEMRDFNPNYQTFTPAAGPFATETVAIEWAEMYC